MIPVSLNRRTFLLRKKIWGVADSGRICFNTENKGVKNREEMRREKWRNVIH
jgi:hypothetical protein